MKILSFDVGIRNLAYIVIDVDTENVNEHKIKQWNVIELCEKDVKACNVDNIIIGMNMMNELDKVLANFDIDLVIIENQIGQNAIKMKTVQGMLNMYFIMKGFNDENIVNYNAVHKLKKFLGTRKTTYNERKKLSKVITFELCKIYYQNHVSFFKAFKKKDDLSDCFLQCIDYMRKKGWIDDEYYSKIEDSI